jgi:hypothetical protein
MIVHLPNGKWQVQSHKGKNLGTFDTKGEAEKHLREVEYFKHKNSLESLSLKISLAHEEPTYSATMRVLRQEAPEKVQDFMKAFKVAFDQAYLSEMSNPEPAALLQALFEIL